jgi:hypothetical protein
MGSPAERPGWSMRGDHMLLNVPMDDGSSMVMEVDEPATGPVAVGRGDTVLRAARTVETALDPVVHLARSVLTKLRESEPAGVTVAFGVKFTAESGVLLSKVTGEANLTVTMSWSAPERGA